MKLKTKMTRWSWIELMRRNLLNNSKKVLKTSFSFFCNHKQDLIFLLWMIMTKHNRGSPRNNNKLNGKSFVSHLIVDYQSLIFFLIVCSFYWNATFYKDLIRETNLNFTRAKKCWKYRIFSCSTIKICWHNWKSHQSSRMERNNEIM